MPPCATQLVVTRGISPNVRRGSPGQSPVVFTVHKGYTAKTTGDWPGLSLHTFREIHLDTKSCAVQCLAVLACELQIPELYSDKPESTWCIWNADQRSMYNKYLGCKTHEFTTQNFWPVNTLKYLYQHNRPVNVFLRVTTLIQHSPNHQTKPYPIQCKCLTHTPPSHNLGLNFYNLMIICGRKKVPMCCLPTL